MRAVFVIYAPLGKLEVRGGNNTSGPDPAGELSFLFPVVARRSGDDGGAIRESRQPFFLPFFPPFPP